MPVTQLGGHWNTRGRVRTYKVYILHITELQISRIAGGYILLVVTVDLKNRSHPPL